MRIAVNKQGDVYVDKYVLINGYDIKKDIYYNVKHSVADGGMIKIGFNATPTLNKDE